MPSALFPAFAITHLDGGPEIVGYLYAAPAVGAFGVSLFSGWIRHVHRQGIAIFIAAILWGVAIIAFGFSSSLWFALTFLAAAGAADAVSAVLRNSVMLASTPDLLQGRVSAAYLAQVTSAPRLGNLEAGAVASLTSVRFSVVSGGVLCVIGGLLIGLAIPSLLKYDTRNRKADAPA
jgi:MFS transporter, ENTS family, enterobactin (siderophore) exporter